LYELSNFEKQKRRRNATNKGFRNNSGSLAIFTAIRRASSLVSSV
jgi:hypothetical protein